VKALQTTVGVSISVDAITADYGNAHSKLAAASTGPAR